VVLSSLTSKELTVNPDKCSFGMKYLEYLGHIVGCGIQAVHRTKAQIEFRLPKTRKELRSYKE